MDPLSQAVVGSALPAAFSSRKNIRLAILCGSLGGMAPDLDIFIRSKIDPLLALEYHRHFTHSIIMSPLVGLVVALGLWLLFSRKKIEFKLFYIFTTLGVITHGLLDTATSYGTYLLWPFSSERLTFSNMPIIDPLFTIPMLLLLIVATIWKNPKIAMASALFGASYIGVSEYNSTLVEQKVREVAESRGHKIERLFLNPTLGNSIVWRTIYESDGRYYVDGVRSIPFKTMQFFAGVEVPKIDPLTVYPKLDKNSQQRKDILRFDHFSMGFLYQYKPNILADLRYGLSVNSSAPLWGIYVDTETPNKHIKRYRNTNDRQQALTDLKRVVFHGELEPMPSTLY